MGFERIPEELKRLRQWVCHKYPNKMPLCPVPGRDGRLFAAKCDDHTTWGTYRSAEQAVREGLAVGVGLQLANGICGVDIDHCFDDSGELSPMAIDIIEELQSYTEISPSGNGIHILCKGKLPDRDGRKDTMLGLEMYDTGRYFTITGNVYCDQEGIAYPVRECTRELDELHKKYLTKTAPKQLGLNEQIEQETKYSVDIRQPDTTAMPRGNDSTSAVRDLTDDQILEIAFRSHGGNEMRRLNDGDWDGAKYKSQSEADLAFANLLAFWFARDADRMDRVFRRSGLMREKWDRSVGGGTTYGQRTLGFAIKGCEQVFVPYDRPHQYEAVPLPEPPPSTPRPVQGHSTGEPPDPPEPPEKDPTLYTYDDTGNAYRFRDAYLDDIKYDHINKTWMIWTGQRWFGDQTGEIKRRADELLEQLRREAEARPNGEGEAMLKHIRRTRSSKAKRAMIEETQHLPGIPILPNEMDRDKDAMNLQNGVVNLRTGELLPHDRELRMSMLADASYSTDSRCPLWLKFLDDITQGDKSLQLYMQRMVGYFLTGSTAEQCMFFLYGTGSNGKSTFVNMVSSLFGDYAKNAQADTIMKADKGNASSARSDIARLKSVRLVTTSEPSGGCILDEALVKTMTGEDVITTRRLYSEEFQFRPEFKIVMATNVKPIIKHSDYGIWRRVRMLPFLAQIPDDQKDIHLAEKLQQEREGIFQWALHGAMAWYQEGFPACPKISAANQEYRKEMDKTQQFLDDCVIREQGSSIPSGRLYATYRAWCAEHGERYPVAQSKFTIDLQDNYHFHRRRTSRFNEFTDIAFTEGGRQLAATAPTTPQ